MIPANDRNSVNTANRQMWVLIRFTQHCHSLDNLLSLTLLNHIPSNTYHLLYLKINQVPLLAWFYEPITYANSCFSHQSNRSLPASFILSPSHFPNTTRLAYPSPIYALKSHPAIKVSELSHRNLVLKRSSTIGPSFFIHPPNRIVRKHNFHSPNTTALNLSFNHWLCSYSIHFSTELPPIITPLLLPYIKTIPAFIFFQSHNTLIRPRWNMIALRGQGMHSRYVDTHACGIVHELLQKL